VNWLSGIEPHWLWLGFGLLLAIGEMTIPGVFLIWMAGAALITGLVSWIFPGIGMPGLVLLFAMLSMASVFAGRRWLRSNPVESADPMMNHRGARSVGEVVTVSQVIADGQGRVKMGDSEWLAKGPDAEPGTKMRVTGSDGSVLLVEHLH
jgi:inner membrane protein